MRSDVAITVDFNAILHRLSVLRFTATDDHGLYRRQL